MKKARILLTLGTLLVLATGVSAVPMTAVDIISGGTLAGSASTRGWAFDLTETIEITSLGWFDEGSDGLVASHPISIWTSLGVELLTGTVGPGDPTAADGFVYTNSITPIVTTLLGPGRYVIGGLATVSATGDRYLRTLIASEVAFNPVISFVENRTRAGTAPGFAFPDSTQTETSLGSGIPIDIGVFGPNFQFNVTPELDPSTGILPFFSMTLLGLASNRRRQQPTA